MSCGVGRRCGLDPALLWLWRRLVATAPMGPLAWELPYATGATLEKANRQKKEKKKGLGFSQGTQPCRSELVNLPPKEGNREMAGRPAPFPTAPGPVEAGPNLQDLNALSTLSTAEAHQGPDRCKPRSHWGSPPEALRARRLKADQRTGATHRENHEAAKTGSYLKQGSVKEGSPA